MINTNDFVFAGVSFQARAGDGLVVPASQVNFDGILPPSANAGLEMEKGFVFCLSRLLSASLRLQRPCRID
jgi:hypothetical protein